MRMGIQAFLRGGLVLLLAPHLALAALGQAPSEHPYRGTTSGTISRVIPHGPYTEHRTATGRSVVREFESNGIVFAVSWSGNRPPDMRKITGKFQEEYRELIGQVWKGGRRTDLEGGTENLVVKTGGHMGDIHGLIYVPSLLPSGVDPNTLP